MANSNSYNNNNFIRNHNITIKYNHEKHIYLILHLQIKHPDDDIPIFKLHLFLYWLYLNFCLVIS